MTPPDFKTLHDQIMSCPGMKYHQLVVAHSASQHIFAGNCQQLRQMLLLIHDPEKSLPMFNVDKRSELALAQNEVVRLFHNFVAGALTLVEHTRIMMRDDSVKKTVRTEYQQRVADSFANNPLAGFVQDLRNYILHKGVPFTGVELNWTAASQTIDTRVFLDLSRMKDWDNWSTRSRTYIDSAKEKVTLLQVVEDYTVMVRSFHEWFIKWFMQLHTTELDQLRALQEQWNRGISPDDRTPPTTST